MQKIAIIGSGWYGLYSALLLQNKFEITVFEQNSDIFNNSSYYNQNRLHLGYHYPKSRKTRKMCLESYEKFLNTFPSIVEDCPNNYYAISQNSLIDFETFIQIFNTPNYLHDIKPNTFMENIDGNLINVAEKIINSDKAKDFFKQSLSKVKFLFDTKVMSVINKENFVIINDTHIFDYCINCTYNQLNLNLQDCIFEKTISLVYERVNFTNDFNAITIMDGGFSSIFPKNIETKQYTLTNVTHTPFFKTTNISDIETCKLSETLLTNIISNMENDIKIYLPTFSNDFKYVSYFTAFKCKLNNKNDSRECVITTDKNIISVHCGKIIGIFEFEEYLKQFFHL